MNQDDVSKKKLSFHGQGTPYADLLGAMPPKKIEVGFEKIVQLICLVLFMY